MPVPVLKKFAKKSGKDLATVEKKWGDAVKQAKKKGADEPYAYATSIVKKRLKLEGDAKTKFEAVYDSFLEGKDFLGRVDSAVRKQSAKISREDTSESAYQKRRNLIAIRISEINSCLIGQDERFKRDPKNWGYPGNLGHVLELLDEVVEFLAPYRK